MRAAFVKNLLWLQLLNWLVKPLWILWIEREIQLRMGDAWYGVYTLHFNLVLLFAVLLDAGLNSYVSREIAAHGRLLHPKRMLFLRLALGLVYVVLVVVVAQVQPGIQGEFLLYALLNQVLASVVLMLRSVLQGKQRFVSDSWLSVVDRVVALAVCTWMLKVYTPAMFGSEGGVLMFQLAQFFGYAMAMLLGLVLVFWGGMRGAGEKDKAQSDALDLKGAEAGKSLGDWSKEVVWFGVMALAMSLFTRIDVQMIQRYAGSALLELPGLDGLKLAAEAGYREIGLYAKGYRLLDAALIFSTLLSKQLLPLLSRRMSAGEDNHPIISLGFRLVFMVSVGVACGAWFYGDFLMNWLYHGQMQLCAVTEAGGVEVLRTMVYSPEILNVSVIFKVLMLAFVPMSLVHVFGTYVTAAGQMRWLAMLALGCLMVNVVFNYVEIPKAGALAAAVGCLLTQWVFAGACIWKTHRLGGYVWHWKQADLVFVSVVGGVLSFGLVKIGIGADGFAGLVWAGLAYAVAVGGYLFHGELMGWLGKKG
jgi:O-antigen/teichoic acid export membrane protein